VHDALLYYIDNDDDMIRSSIKYVQSVMESVPVRRGLTLVPFKADAKVGKNWGELKTYK
jgi:DNA polymerase I-like protein with 3'-5' exonuclease and polymerase domains